MDYENETMVAVAYWGSNLVGVALLLVSFKWTRIARLLFAVLFGYAFWINVQISHATPEVYLDYAPQALNFYATFIMGWFSEHITTFVTFIAVGQLLIAVGMLLKGKLVTFSAIGVIVFLIAIAPLGYYAAFPFSITVSAAAYMIIRRDEKQYLWKKRERDQVVARRGAHHQTVSGSAAKGINAD